MGFLEGFAEPGLLVFSLAASPVFVLKANDGDDGSAEVLLSSLVASLRIVGIELCL